MIGVSISLVFAVAIAADGDAVTRATGKDRQGRATIRGSILDFAGGQLTIRTSTGREKRVPHDQIVHIDVPWNENHRQARAFAEQGKYDQAVNEYVQAWRQEQRPWVQRQIMADMVRCLLQLGRFEMAGDGFLALIRSDSQTHYFDAIPLAWTPRALSAESQQKAQAWLESEQEPVAVLMGASWLLPLTARRAAATQALQGLSDHADSRIAYLATAQLWRLQVVTATAQETQRWQAAIDRMPSSLRAGPYFILGQSLAKQGHSEPAALALMRVPILYPDNHELASQALRIAAGELEKLGLSKEADRLYLEVVQDYPTTPAAAEAQGHLNRVGEPGD